MLFKNDEASLQLEAVNYEFPSNGGAPGSDDRNWLVFRATYTSEGCMIKDSNSCLLTYELREMTAGLKVLCAGIKDSYGSDFVEPYFELSAQTTVDACFIVDVSFALPNTMEDMDCAEIECTMTKSELSSLIDELDDLCKKYPDRP